jgi:amino acid adenylation domain-containing protein
LNGQSGRLANFLRKQGIKRGQPVAVCRERFPEMVVALLATLKTGAYYLPLDPSHPRERLALITGDIAKGGQPPLLLTQSKLLDLFPDYQGVVVCVDRDHSLIATEPAASPESGADSSNLAYAIYTSGSTGIPKGVKITHKSLVNFLESMRREPGITAHDTLLAVTTVSFDIAGLELWLPLISGAAVVLAKESEVRDGRILARLLEEHQVTIMQATPSTWKILCESGWKGRPGMKLLCGGEAFPPALAARLLAMGGEVWNLYGPTETTIWSSLCKVEKEADPIPIGHPIGNTYLYVLDAYQNPVPRGVRGELYIGGDGVAEGYTRDDETTCGKFLADPFCGKRAARMYRTGDLVRRLPDGELEYLGRLDHQVKIRGYRIETKEIETAMRLHPHVKEALVTLTKTKTDLSGLVAYYVPSGAAQPAELRQFLRDKLPEYMLPSFLIPLEAFPLTPNGKIDRKKLPGPKADKPDPDSGYIAPKNRTEKQLTDIFQEILGIEKVGIHDKFFDLGGNSILATILQSRIIQEFPGREVSIVDLFQHTSVAELSRFLKGEVSAEPTDRAAVRTGIRARTPDHEDIAIVGMSCRFPKSENLQMFWENLAGGRECITFYSDDELEKSGVTPEVYNDSRYVRGSGSLDGIEQFDAPFFNYSPKEAALIDPQQRIFLEEAWRAMEDAGLVPEYFPGKIGVYAGIGMNDYMTRNLSSHRSLFDGAGGYQLMIGNDKDFVATRVSYELNLAGPAVTVQTACSSSLTAVHMACQAIRCGECEMALAGGVSLRVPQKAGYTYNEGMILSPDGHCRAFDGRAKGTVIGSGAGVVVLKPLMSALQDGDTIYAVIKGSALNNDGSHKAAFTAPGPQRQADVICDALRNAGVGSNEISYVETHGTGTVIGDPIEITALTRAFDLDESARNSCPIGSVKTNIGHLDAAAGVAGLIKTALALYHRKIPASLHFETPNPKINFKESPFYVNTALSDWESDGKPLYAGVSSFGIGGTNAHLILGEAPQPPETPPSDKKCQILTLSAKTPGSLAARAEDMQKYLTDHEDASFPNAAFTLAVGRVPMRCRAAIVCADTQEASRLLREPDSAHIFSGVTSKSGMRIAFLFPGQGSQYIDMAKALYQTETLFRETMDACFALVRKYSGEDLKSVIYPADADREKAASLLEQTENAQPAIFILEYSLAKLLLSWGIKPAAMCGHSVGEYAAACLAGVFSPEDAIRLLTLRGRLIGQLPEGKMLSVQLSEDALIPMLDGALSVAAVNGAENCVVSGSAESIKELSRRCAGMDIPAKALSVSHALHSFMLDPILPDFKDAVSSIKLNPPSMRYVSGCTGRWIEDSEATDPEYWVRHLRHGVRFFDAATVLLGLPDTVMLEAGPGKALSSLLRRHPAKADQSLILNALPHPLETISADQSLYRAAARLWVAGAFDDWTGFYKNEPANRIHLPGYSFEKRRCWIEPGASVAGSLEEDEVNLFSDAEDEQQSVDVRSFLTNVYVPADSEDEKALAEIWQDILGINTVGVTDNFFEMGGTSLMLTQLLALMRQRFADLPLTIKGLYENPTIRETANYIEALRAFRGGEDSGGEYEGEFEEGEI